MTDRSPTMLSPIEAMQEATFTTEALENSPIAEYVPTLQARLYGAIQRRHESGLGVDLQSPDDVSGMVSAVMGSLSLDHMKKEVQLVRRHVRGLLQVNQENL